MRSPADIAADLDLYEGTSVPKALLREAAEALRSDSYALVAQTAEALHRSETACREVIELLDLMEHPIKPQLLERLRGKPPRWLGEALNSGDGTYRP